MKKIKNYFITGILVWLPLGLTAWILSVIIGFLNQLLPHSLSDWLFGIHIPGGGLVLTLSIILLTGLVVTNIFGKKLFAIGEKILFKIPIVKSIYKGIKQVSDTLLSSQGNAFRKALLVKFPYANSWTIAFITGVPIDIMEGESEYINVYVPTTPNPTSGYFIIVKKCDTRELNMTVDQALRYVISMGVVDPRIDKTNHKERELDAKN